MLLSFGQGLKKTGQISHATFEANCSNEELPFLASAIKSKNSTPDVVSVKQPKTIFEFGLPSIIAGFFPKEHWITVPHPVRSCC